MLSSKKTLFLTSFIFLGVLLLSSCSRKAQCPAYMEFSGGTISVQDKGAQTPDEIRKQSQKLLDAQDSYIVVKRDKRTGLVKNKKRVKKGKNNTNKHKGFEVDPRTMKGVK